MEGITSNSSSDIAWYVQTNLCEIFVVEIVLIICFVILKSPFVFYIRKEVMIWLQSIQSVICYTYQSSKKVISSIDSITDFFFAILKIW